MPRGGGALSARHRAILARVARSACPPDIAGPERMEAVLDHAGLTIAAMAPLVRRAFLLGVELDAATRLPGARFVAASATGRRLRRSVRDVLVIAYFDHPEVKASLGYDPDRWTASVGPPRQARWAAAIAAHRQLLVERRPRPPRPW